MAQTKTDYGLIYNDDGSVCTTVRPDQIPFVGVNSFAVETATTNLLSSDSASFENSVGNWETNLDAAISVSDDYSYFGEKSLKVENTDGGFSFSTGSYLRYDVGNHMTDDNNYYTVSMYVYSPTTIIIEIANLNFVASNGDISLKKFTIPGGQWKRIWATIYYANPTAVLYQLRMGVRSDYAGQTFYIDGAQFEAKQFASSFTVGSRPNGRLVIPVEDLKFDIANDDWVISYWKYPVATRDDTQNSYNTCSLGQNPLDGSKGYIFWGKESSINKYLLYVVLNDATGIRNISDNTFNPTDYFYHWHYEVVKKSGKVLSYYVDGVKQIEYTIPADKELQTPFDVGLHLGGFIERNRFYPNNTLIANVGNGKLKPGEFTDEHIMAIYEANRAFAQKGGVKIY